jgi:Type VI secretion system, TssF
MTTSKQHIKESMMQSAAKMWGLSETDNEASFDPLVGLLMGACATELEKINGEIENSRTRVLERLVQLLSPEALTGVLPAHAIAYALPAEQIGYTNAEDQFYTSTRFTALHEGEHAAYKEIYFSPISNFKLHKAIIKYKAVGNKIIQAEGSSNNIQQIVASNNLSLPSNEIWLGIDTKTINVNGLRFYFDVIQQSQKKLFFNQLPKAEWYADNEKINNTLGYSIKKNEANYFDIDAVLNRDISATEKIENHIHEFYEQQFITLQDEQNNIEKNYKSKAVPQSLKNIFDEKELIKIEAQNFFWVCIKFPENIHNIILEDINININCFPVVNRHLYDINFRIKEFVNIIPLLSEENFLDIYSIADQQGNQLHLLNNNEAADDDCSILLRYGGVGRFDDREAAETVDKLIHLLREETAAFSILGNDFLQSEMTTLQQTINKLEQQITNKQLLKSSTPYLIINNKQKDTRQSVYVKYWASNGASANLIKAGTALSVYSSSQFESGTSMLITNTQGGRNKLNDTEKVLAYKSALLSKQKLVTTEDIKAFCKLRLAITTAAIEIKKGFSVLPAQTHGLVRTLDIIIVLQQKEWISLKEKGNVIFWQEDLATAINQHSNFFIPVRVFITEKHHN